MMKVLVADDEYKICQLICLLINWEELDMELAGMASNGVEALDLIREKRPDLVLTDIRMPGFDGLELLRQARDIIPEAEFIVISGYSHFEYAQKAIHCGVSDYILKPVDQESLNATLKKVSQRFTERKNKETVSRILEKQKEADAVKLRGTLWNDIVSGKIEVGREQINKKYYYHFEKGCFQIFLIETSIMDNVRIMGEYTENLSELMYSKVLLYLQKFMEPFCIELETFHQRERVYGIINYRSEEAEKVSEAFRSIIHSIGVDLSVFENVRFYLSLGEIFSEPEDSMIHYWQADKAMGEHLFCDNTFVLEKIPEDARYNEDSLFQSFSSSLRQSMELYNADGLKAAVFSLKAGAVENQLNGCQLFTLVKNAYRIFILSSVFQKEFHFEDRERMEADFDESVMLCGSVDSLFLFLEDRCRRNLEDAIEMLDRKRMRPISQAKQYIQMHYAKPLSLERVSMEVGFSPSYFSTVFKKETGTTFLEYLMSVRIEEAKKLLRESHINIELIAGLVGSNDSKRFSKTFRKLTGITPKEYRNLYS